MSERVEPKPYLPATDFHPGTTLAEVLESRGISQVELASRANRPIQAINEIINNKKEITAETALDFEKVLGVNAGFWLQLQKNYQEALARERELVSLRSQSKYIRLFPYKEMAEFGWVEPTKDRIERTAELLRWLGMGHIHNTKTQYRLAFRKSSRYSLSKEKLSVWLRYGELHFQKLKDVNDFDIKSRGTLIEKLRHLTLEAVREATNKLREICLDYGVVLVFTREFKSFPVSGVTRWVAKHPLIQVTLRGKSDDKFWFSIFHELGHVYLLHNKSDTFINPLGEWKDKDVKEKEADKFACDYLIPSSDYKLYTEKKTFTEVSIRTFASNINIAPSIVVGRLQHDDHIPMSSFNNMKTWLNWVPNKHEEQPS